MSYTKKRVLKGGAGFFTSNLITKGLGFLFIVICSRVLGANEFGVFSLGLSVIGVATNIGGIGLPNTIQRFLSGKGEQRVEQIYGGILIISTISIILFSTIVYFSSSYIAIDFFGESKLKEVLQVLSIGVGATIAFNVYKAILQAQEKIKEIVIGNATNSLFRVILLVIIFLWATKAVSAAIAQLVSISFVAVYFFKNLKKIPFKSLLPKRRDLRKIFSYSLPLILVGFSYFLMQQTDRLMLGWLSTSTEVGIYTAISSLALVMSMFHASLVSIFMPVASEAYREKKYSKLSETYLFISKWVGRLNGVVILIFSGVGLWILGIFGSEYANHLSYLVLLLLSFLYFLGTWLGPTGALLQMSDGHKVEFYNTLVFLTLNIVLNYFLILKYGLLGAAIATLISGVVRNVLQAIEIKFFYSINVINKRNTLFFIIVLLGILMCYIIEPYRIYVMLFFVVTIAINTYLTIKDDEKKLINEFIGQKIR